MVDHRKLGRELELFCSDPLSGAGLPIWLPAGAAARHAVEEYVYERQRRAGYQQVVSPPLGKRELFELSGHAAHFDDDMFPPMRMSADDELVLRPSLCPHHALVFAARGRSYRELPLRIAEQGGMYRSERSGVLGGLSRVRAISLNDGHTFCTADQVVGEVCRELALIRQAHAELGVQVSGFRLSLRGEGGKYVDDPAMWARASAVLREALQRAGIAYDEAPGEAAFYGPKIDIQIRDGAGREQTLSTVQVDYDKPARFGLSYVAEDGSREAPVMIHRSMVGSMERLFAHLIEVHAGAFPAWYAPVQLDVLPVSADQDEAAYAVQRAAIEAGLRAEVSAGGSLGARIRQSALRKIPYAAVLGAREAASGEVALRLRDGRTLTAVQLQGEYLERARKYVDDRYGSDVDPQTAQVLTEWESVLTRFAQDPMLLAGELDWVAKLRLLNGFAERDRLDWSSPRLHAIDLQYADVRPGKGLFHRLVQRGSMRTLIDPDDAVSAMNSPPTDTRAYFRGECLRRYPDAVAAASWDSVIFDVGQQSLVRVPTLDPLRGSRAHVQELLDRCPTAQSLVQELLGR
jgi:threonyl-tRNA synthetase